MFQHNALNAVSEYGVGNGMTVQKTLFAKVFFACIFMFFVKGVYGQSTYYAEAMAGYTFSHRGFYLGQEHARSIHGATFSLGAYGNIPVKNRLSFQTGFYAMGISASGRVGPVGYSSRSLKFYIPLRLGVSINDKIKLSGGAGIRNNKDLQMWHIRGSNNLRYDLALRIDYKIGSRWNAMFSIHQNMGLPEVFLVNDPPTQIQMGLNYRLFSGLKKGYSQTVGIR